MKNLASIIKNGGVAVIKTDTLYGIVGLASDQNVVDRIYKIKKRDPLKPIVVLISDLHEIKNFGVHLSDEFREITELHWPGRVSIIAPVSETLDLHYLHKGTGGVAFRVPDDEVLREMLRETGPLVAPSANPEGLKPAKNIKEAMAYFGDQIDFYQDKGECTNDKASKIIRVTEDFDVEIVRE